MKLKQIIDSKEALNALLKNSLPINIAWELKKFLIIVNPELTTFEELRTQKIIEMGEEIINDDKPTGTYQVKEDNIGEFTKVITQLIDKDIEINIPKIYINDLLNHKDVNGKGIDILTTDLILLDWLIVDN